MAPITPLHQPDTAATIRAGLLENGTAVARLAELTISAADWRRIARQVARELHRPIRTAVFDEQVYATLTDYPRDEDEARRQQVRLRRVLEQVAIAQHLPGQID